MHADVVHREDVGMAQRGGGARFLLESPHPVGIGRERGGNDLDGDIASEARIVRAIHLAHAARADQLDDVVRTDAGA